VHFVFKPENFVKTDGFFVYSEKEFVPLVTIYFVKKNVLEMKHQVNHLGKGLASFFLQYYIGVCDGVE